MQIVAYSAVLFILFTGVLRWAIKHNKKLRQPMQIPNGVSATGIILDFHKSGNKFSQPAGGINGEYKMLIRIQVTNENGHSWMTKTKEYVHESQFNLFRIGNTVPVKYDPKNTNNVIVDCERYLSTQPSAHMEW